MLQAAQAAVEANTTGRVRSEQLAQAKRMQAESVRKSHSSFDVTSAKQSEAAAVVNKLQTEACKIDGEAAAAPAQLSVLQQAAGACQLAADQALEALAGGTARELLVASCLRHAIAVLAASSAAAQGRQAATDLQKQARVT